MWVIAGFPEYCFGTSDSHSTIKNPAARCSNSHRYTTYSALATTSKSSHSYSAYYATLENSNLSLPLSQASQPFQPAPKAQSSSKKPSFYCRVYRYVLVSKMA